MKRSGPSLSSSFKKNDRDKLIEYLRAGECVTVVGIPGMGKSLFIFMLYRNQQDLPPHKYLRFIEINLNDLTESSPQIFYWLLAQRLFETLKGLTKDKKILEQADQIYRECQAPVNDFQLFACVKHILALYVINWQPVLIFDEFEEFASTMPPLIFKNLKALRDSFKRKLHFVFISNREPQLIKEVAGDYAFRDLTGRRILYLQALTPVEAKELIVDYERSKEVLIRSNLFTLLYRLTNGHTGLLMDLARLSLKKPKLKNEDDFLTAALEDEGVLTRMQRIEQAQVTLADLAKRNLSIPILETYLKNQAALGDHAESVKRPPGFPSLLKAEKFRYDEKTNQIFVDNQLCVNLTAKEFELFRYLIKNLGRVCGKDEIAENVWKGEASAGVSDEAIDKLVQRVRTKIEENKSKPQYLLTVRGRGYQLTESL